MVQIQETKLQQKKLSKECVNSFTPKITFQGHQLSLSRRAAKKKKGEIIEYDVVMINADSRCDET